MVVVSPCHGWIGRRRDGERERGGTYAQERDGCTTVHVEYRYLVVCLVCRGPLGHTRCRLQARGRDALCALRDHFPCLVRSGTGGGTGRYALLVLLCPA